MFLIIDRFLLSRLESLSAAPTSLSFLRFAPSLSNPPRAVKGETVSVVSVFLHSSRRPSSALRDLRPRSSSDVRRNSLRKTAPLATDSPTLASRLVGQCFYSDAGASGGKTLISRLNLYPSATCRALWACPLWHLWSVSASALQTRKPPTNTTGQRRYLRPNVGAVIVQHHTPGSSYRRHKFICHD